MCFGGGEQGLARLEGLNHVGGTLHERTGGWQAFIALSVAGWLTLVQAVWQ